MHKKFEDILNSGETLYYRNVGDSMYPLIVQDRTLLKISPKSNERLKKWDIPLYKRDNGQYVLHRIVKVKKDEYYLRGDNRIYTEKGIEDRHIIGVLTAIIEDGKEINISPESQRMYILSLYMKYPFKYLNTRFNNLIRKIKKKHI